MCSSLFVQFQPYDSFPKQLDHPFILTKTGILNIIFVELDECCVGGYCHDNATCTNVPGGYSCTCKTGYTGNNTHCEGKDGL